jgi:hypothetical protein
LAVLQYPTYTFPLFSILMNNPRTISRKRKRGKDKYRLIEGEDDASEFVTVKEVTIDTPIGPVKKLVELPLRPIASSEAGPSSQPRPLAASQVPDFGVVTSDIFEDALNCETSRNKVVNTYAIAEMLINSFQRQFWMQEFVDRGEVLLGALLAREALPNEGMCMQCVDRNKQAIWRCKDCTLSEQQLQG